jgi:hypothetical protein
MTQLVLDFTQRDKMASLHTGVPKKHRIGVWDFISSHPEMKIDTMEALLFLGHEGTLIRLSESGLASLGWRYAYLECFFYQIQNQRSYRRKLKRLKESEKYLADEAEAEKQIDQERKAYRLYLESQKGLI